MRHSSLSPIRAGHYVRLHKNTVVLGLTPAPVPAAAESGGLPLQPSMVAFNYGAGEWSNEDVVQTCEWLCVLKWLQPYMVAFDYGAGE